MALRRKYVDRVIARLLQVLLLLAPQAAAASNVIVLLSPEDAREVRRGDLEARLASQGMELSAVISAEDLETELNMIPIRPGTVDVACLERVSLRAWERDLQRAEMFVQTFKADRAIELSKRLEDQLVCLDGVPPRKSLRSVFLTRALALFVEGRGGYELDEAVDQALGVGADLTQPLGLPPELQARFERPERVESVRIFGAGPKGELFVDGESLATGAVLRGVGKHLVQLVEGRSGQVSSAQVWPFPSGRALVWAGELGPRPIGLEIRKVIEDQGSSALLRAISVALRRTLLVGEVRGKDLTLMHVDGRVVLRPERKPTRKEGKKKSTKPVVSTRPTVQPEENWSVSGGAGLEADGLRRSQSAVLRGIGVGVWARIWAPSSYSIGISSGWVLRPELLPPAEPDFYAMHKALPLRIGAYWRGHKRRTHAELGLHGLAEIGLGESDGQVGLGVSFGIYSPVWQQAALRFGLRSEVGQGWWTNSLSFGAEWRQ